MFDFFFGEMGMTGQEFARVLEKERREKEEKELESMKPEKRPRKKPVKRAD